MTAASMRRARELRLAVATGAVGGILLGCREGLMTFAGNSFANAEQYAPAYVIVPIAVWFMLGPLLLIPVALLAPLLGAGDVRRYAGALAGVGTALALLPSVEQGIAEMHATGAAPRLAVVALLVAAVAALALGAALVVRGAAAAYAARSRRAARWACLAATAVGGIACAWTARFMIVSTRPPAAAATVAASSRVLPPGSPNLLLISIDTLRADALGAYGAYGVRPAVARSARRRRGHLRERDHSGAVDAARRRLGDDGPRSATSRRRRGHESPRSARTRAARRELAPTLAGTLAAGGWRTQAIVTNPYLLSTSGLAAGSRALRQSDLPLRGGARRARECRTVAAEPSPPRPGALVIAVAR